MAESATTDNNDDLADGEVLLDALCISISSGATAAPRETSAVVVEVVVAPPTAQVLPLAEQPDYTASPNNNSETTTTTTTTTTEPPAPPVSSSLSSSRQEEEQDNGSGDRRGGCGRADSSQKKTKKNADADAYYTILCDMSYGMPSEARPRKEKIRAIARQLVNFLSWQWQQQQQQATLQKSSDNGSSPSPSVVAPSTSSLLQPAQIKIVGCNDAAIEQSLKNRMLELWVQEQKVEAATGTGSTKPMVVSLPNNLSFTHQSLESFVVNKTTRTGTKQDEGGEEAVTDSFHDDKTTAKGTADHGHGQEQYHHDVVYLSPDAEIALDASSSHPPPSIVVVGLLIDRKHIQVNRSRKRAQALSIPAVRWPLEKIVLVQQQQQQQEEKEDDAKSSSNSRNTMGITLHASEPLNCDCILEGMQQWYWNYETWSYHQECSTPVVHCDDDDDDDDDQQKKKKAAAAIIRATTRETCLSDAILQALQHHVERHPGRPIHKTKNG